MGMVELVYVGGLLRMVDDSLLVPVWRWVHWQRRPRCVASQGRYLMAREPPWKQNGLPPTVNIMKIAHGFFTSPQGRVCIPFLFTLPTFSFIVSPAHSTPTSFLFDFFFFFSLLSSNFTAFSVHVASQYVARLGPNILILSQSCQHLFSVLLGVHKSSFHQVVSSNAKPSSELEFSLSSSLPAIIASYFVHSLVDQSRPRSVFLQFCEQIQ